MFEKCILSTRRVRNFYYHNVEHKNGTEFKTLTFHVHGENVLHFVLLGQENQYNLCKSKLSNKFLEILINNIVSVSTIHNTQ